MRYLKAASFQDTIRPIILVAKIMFLFFGSFDLQQRIVRRTLLDQFCSAIAILVDLYLMNVGIRGSSGFLTMTDSNLLNVGIYGAMVLSYVIGLSISWIIHFKEATIVQLINSVVEFDAEMLKLGFSLDHQRSHRYSVLAMCWVVSIGASNLIIALTFGSDNSWLNLSAMYPDRWTIIAFTRAIFGSNFLGCIFCLTLIFLKIRYSLLNKAMTKYIRAINGITCQGEQRRLIRKYSAMHDRLSLTIELFNDCYGLGAMCGLWCTLSLVIFSIFGLIHAYAAGSDDTTLRVGWVHMFFSCGCFVFIIQLVASASLVNDECKILSSMVHKTVAYVPFHSRLHRELHHFSQQLVHQAPKISCQMFDFDWTLLYSLCGTLATYLVILLQFDIVNIKQAIFPQEPSIPENISN